MKTPHGRAEIEAVFGNPSNQDGTLNEAWEGEFIRKIPPPDPWVLFYQSDKGPVRVSGLRLHRLLEDALLAVLDDVWAHATGEVGGQATTEKVRRWLSERRLDQHGGAFNFRKITGGSKLSLHAYGIAIDWDPEHNPRKKPLTKTLPDWWYEVWKAHGFSDGRKFPTPDPMHVQFATGA